jgi:MFS family permease
MGNGGGVGLVRDDSGGRRLRAFRSLAGNRALLRVLAAYLLFILTEYAVWIAMIVFAYNRGGTAVAGFVAMAQLVPAAIVAPVATSIADRRSPVAQLTAANVVAGWLEAAGLLAGVLISAAGVASVFAVCAGFGLWPCCT